uniref:Uncharacterized protein n=1 Tax=Oryza punctata TaxID=4537 RepID=A0A0E0JT69_ORYPU
MSFRPNSASVSPFVLAAEAREASNGGARGGSLSFDAAEDCRAGDSSDSLVTPGRRDIRRESVIPKHITISLDLKLC